MLQFPSLAPYWWLAVPADYGTLILIVCLPWLANEFWKTASFNLLHEFGAFERDRTIRVKLYRRGVAVIDVEFKQPIPHDNQPGGLISFGMGGTWSKAGENFELAAYRKGRTMELALLGEQYVAVERADSSIEPAHEALNGFVLRKLD